MPEVWLTFKKEVQGLEEQLLKAEAINAFINSEGVKEEFTKEELNKFQKYYNKILDYFRSIESKTSALTTQAQFEDFRYFQGKFIPYLIYHILVYRFLPFD